jgi:hypothetical protein
MASPPGHRSLKTGDAKMPPLTSKSEASGLLRIALLILGLAVFAWGLQYKLSLYEASSHHHPVSVAKLMQGEQTNKKIMSLQLQIRSKFSQLQVDSAIVPLPLPEIVRRNRRPDTLIYTSITFVTCVLFFRPPPQAS